MKRLVIAAHVDDDVIGCGGMLDSYTTVFYCGVDDFHVVSAEDRRREAQAVSEVTGHKYIWPDAHKSYIGPVNHYDFTAVKDHLEDVIKELAPSEVYLPWPSYNRDHQTVYEAAMVALRPHDRNPLVPRVLLYEEPDCWWPMLGQPFVPNFYRRIDAARKIKLYRMMESQVRGHRSPLHLFALSQVRGAAIGTDYAEAYHVLRWVE